MPGYLFETLEESKEAERTMQPREKTPQPLKKVNLPGINWIKKHYGYRQMCATETALLEVILMVFAVVPLPKVTESRFWQELLLLICHGK